MRQNYMVGFKYAYDLSVPLAFNREKRKWQVSISSWGELWLEECYLKFFIIGAFAYKKAHLYTMKQRRAMGVLQSSALLESESFDEG